MLLNPEKMAIYLIVIKDIKHFFPPDNQALIIFLIDEASFFI
jgi:hypothetical protein